MSIQYDSVFGNLEVTVHDPKRYIARRTAESAAGLKLQFSGFSGTASVDAEIPSLANSPSHPSKCFTATATVCK